MPQRSAARHDPCSMDTEMYAHVEAKYALGEVLGSGGMGIVYVATQRSVERRVAVKVPHPELAQDPFVAKRFRIEALAAARVSHRNVARLIDFGGGDTVAPYIVMEHIAGTRLDLLAIEAGGLDLRVTLELGHQLLSALDAVHAAGVVHGDIKTSNVLVETLPDGVLLGRLIDFGLARFLDDPAGLDMRVLSGTPDYLAPELVQGGIASIASDIYAAGILLYELVTGTTPFGGGTSAEIMNRHVTDAVVPPSLRSPDQAIPPAVEAVIMRALAKAPGDRFATAAAAAAALPHTRASVLPPPLQLARAPLLPAVFSAEATTQSWSREPLGPPVHDIASARRAVAVASARGIGNMIAAAYLDLTRQLIDRRELDVAATELGFGLALLRSCEPAHRHPMWRLQLCLAAVYSGLGDPARARQAASQGRDDADLAGSALGVDRAERLLARLSRAR